MTHILTVASFIGASAPAFNYAPLTVGFVLLAVGSWWLLSARKTFTGPVRTIEMDDTGRVLGEKPLDPQ